jgi:hypothetical protein
MAWVKIDDAFSEHPKILRAGPIATVLYVRALCYCNRNLTDGFLPSAVVEMMSHDLEPIAGGEFQNFNIGDLMVECGLWEVQPGGWRVHDYLDYNPSKKQVVASRKQHESASRKGGLSRWQSAIRNPDGTLASSRNGRTSPGVPAKVTDQVTTSPDPDPDPDPVPRTTRSRSTARVQLDPLEGFVEFWNVYPKRRSRADAEKAWRALKPDVALRSAILAALSVQSRSKEWLKGDPPGEFVPLAATWIRGERWLDEADREKPAWEPPEVRAQRGDRSGLAGLFDPKEPR